ncbi:MAG: beta-1,6-glucan synthase [Betaproteobacteria bacterium HGW-Betaproteobacteria-1]|jgi:exo-beta-1,3-glucanase (GH17 family)|nr:MAG: beta-1,6-glucan synthase [Betaproteobacteria bacterium HGW-Betaproteobacteria-1]
MLRNQLRSFAVLNILLLISLAGWLYWQNRPVQLAVPELPQQKMQCASYAPYYTPGQSPFIKGTHISPQQIEHDLALLAERFDCVRTYSVGQGLDHVPEAAGKLGLEVLLGVWIGWTDAENQRELTLGLKLANQHPDVIRALIVGNEVLLRKEQKPAKLKAYLERARASTDIPITYADVWEFWLKNKEIEDSVDFITAHILPYWEDEPQAIEASISHAVNVMNRLEQTFDKPILIGETGWPSAGRHRNGSAPGNVNQARYIREFLQTAHEKEWRYNLIEAFDQPWKRVLEGTVGGHWGIYDSQLQAKFSLTDAIAERNDGWWPWLSAFAGMLLFGLLGLRAKSTGNTTRNALAMLPLGAAAGIMVYLQAGYLVDACRDILEWLALGGVALFGWVGLLALPTLALNQSATAKRCAGLSLWLLAATALIGSALLLFDGRYRDFPLSLYLLPALQFGLLAKLAGMEHIPQPRAFVHMLVLAAIFSLTLLVLEPSNLQLWAWISLLLLLISSAVSPSRQPDSATIQP